MFPRGKIQPAYRCEGTEFGDNWSDERYDGICDKDGCDFNSWRLGDLVDLTVNCEAIG